MILRTFVVRRSGFWFPKDQCIGRISSTQLPFKNGLFDCIFPFIKLSAADQITWNSIQRIHDFFVVAVAPCDWYSAWCWIFALVKIFGNGDRILISMLPTAGLIRLRKSTWSRKVMVRNFKWYDKIAQWVELTHSEYFLNVCGCLSVEGLRSPMST